MMSTTQISDYGLARSRFGIKVLKAADERATRQLARIGRTIARLTHEALHGIDPVWWTP